jgi:hypothetical protein
MGSGEASSIASRNGCGGEGVETSLGWAVCEEFVEFEVVDTSSFSVDDEETDMEGFAAVEVPQFSKEAYSGQ